MLLGPSVPLLVASVLPTARRMLGEAGSMREMLCVFVLVVGGSFWALVGPQAFPGVIHL